MPGFTKDNASEMGQKSEFCHAEQSDKQLNVQAELSGKSNENA